MSPFHFEILLFVVSIFAGVLGSLVGIGGGAVIVPLLTLVFHVDIRLAIGASIVSVIATSSGAAVAYVREKMTNIRVGMFLEIATTVGAVSGAIITSYVPDRLLFILFGLILAYSGFSMYKKHKEPEPLKTSTDKLANRLRLDGEYIDKSTGETVTYAVSGTKMGLFLMYIAGLVSALLGIGSGALKVPAMDLAMKIPLKASSATSNFMIGVTAAASAGVYFSRGDINPLMTGPVAIGILIGAVAGSRMLSRLNSRYLRIIFVVVISIIALEMLQRGFS